MDLSATLVNVYPQTKVNFALVFCVTSEHDQFSVVNRKPFHLVHVK